MQPRQTNRYQEIIQLGEPSLAVHKLVGFLTDHFVAEARNPEKRLLLELASRELVRTIASTSDTLTDSEIEQKACYEVVQALLKYNNRSNLVTSSVN